MTRRRAIFAQPAEPVSAPVMERPQRKPMPGHWKQRVKLAQHLGATVTKDAEARVYLREHGYGDIL